MHLSPNVKYYDILFYKSYLESQYEDSSWKSDEFIACFRTDVIWNRYVWWAYVSCLEIPCYSAAPLIWKQPHMVSFKTQFS